MRASVFDSVSEPVSPHVFSCDVGALASSAKSTGNHRRVRHSLVNIHLNIIRVIRYRNDIVGKYNDNGT